MTILLWLVVVVVGVVMVVGVRVVAITAARGPRVPTALLAPAATSPSTWNEEEN